MIGLYPKFSCTLNVLRGVVYEQDCFWTQSMVIQDDLKGLGIRFSQLNFVREVRLFEEHLDIV